MRCDECKDLRTKWRSIYTIRGLCPVNNARHSPVIENAQTSHPIKFKNLNTAPFLVFDNDMIGYTALADIFVSYRRVKVYMYNANIVRL